MPEETSTQEPLDAGQDTNEETATEQTPIDSLPNDTQDYIRRLREENAKHRTALKQAQDAQAAERQKQLAEQGKWKELAEDRERELKELDAVRTRADALDATIRDSNKQRIERIPENMRGVVPVDYAPEKLAAWLDTNAAVLARPTPPQTDAGAGGGSGSITVTDADRRASELAKASGYTVTPDAIAKRRLEAEKGNN